MGNGGGDGPDGPGGIGAIGGMEGLGEFGGVGGGMGGGGYGPGDPNAGGGPVHHQVFNPVETRPVVQQQQNALPNFTIDPNQALNDIALGSGWGMPGMMPQMNPFSMYGNQQSPFNWGGYLNQFGGK